MKDLHCNFLLYSSVNLSILNQPYKNKILNNIKVFLQQNIEPIRAVEGKILICINLSISIIYLNLCLLSTVSV